MQTVALPTRQSASSFGPSRCADCDSDCWAVENKTKCWLGGTNAINGVEYEIDIAEGYCPWLHDGLEFPPAPET